MRADDRERVTAVVVTWNRAALLTRCLRSLEGQTATLERIVVVDNASSDETLALLATMFPTVEVLALPLNEGFGAGLRAGVSAALAGVGNWIWLFDDDSEPAPTALARLLEYKRQFPEVAAFCIDGSHVDMMPTENAPLSLTMARKALVDGCLVAADAVRAVGNFRADFFMMMEDYEFLSRIHDSGRKVGVVDEPLLRRDHVGGANMPAWRGYYQARNHLRFALDRRDLSEVGYCVARQAKRMLYDLVYLDRPAHRSWLRVSGFRDALTGRMGKQNLPS